MKATFGLSEVCGVKRQSPTSFNSHEWSEHSCRGLLPLLFSIVVLSGCGGGGDGNSPISASPSSNSTGLTSGGVAADITSINGVTVPPDPGAAGKKSPAGVDTNANGVRDEVERELAAYYGKASVAHAAAMNFARRLQTPLSTPITTSTQATSAIIDGLVAFECFAATFGNRDDALTAAQIIATRSFNTKLRVAEQTRIYDLSGLTELPDVGAQQCN